jgi:hypothetical protein
MLAFFGKKRKTPKNSWCNGFVSKRCAHHEHRKTHDFINWKGSFDRESLVAL